MILLALAGLMAGAPPLGVGVVLAAVRFPLPTGAVLLLLAARSLAATRPTGSRDVAFLVGMAAELRAGAGLRQALAAVATDLPGGAAVARLAGAGRPMAEVAVALEGWLEQHGAICGAALRLSDRVGGPLAPVFDELAGQAIDLEELARERRAAMAPAVAQGVVVGGLPLLALARMVAAGDLLRLGASGPVGAVVVGLGTTLTLSGVVAVASMINRSRR